MIPFLHLGPLTIPTFGLMVVAAMAGAYFLLRSDLQRRHIVADAESFIAIPCLAGIVGAKIYHVLETPRDLIADPIHEVFSQYGFAWFGGLIAGCAAFIWLTRRHKIPILLMLDVGAPAAALGYGIGRIGCFLAGDGDYGIPTSLPWGVSFPNGLVPTTQRVHPTPLYELIVGCLIAWILWRLGSRQISLSRRNGLQWPHRGQIFAAYLFLTGVTRFLVEFIRINPRSFLGLTNAQIAGLASIVAGVGLYIWLAQHQKSVTL